MLFKPPYQTWKPGQNQILIPTPKYFTGKNMFCSMNKDNVHVSLCIKIMVHWNCAEPLNPNDPSPPPPMPAIWFKMDIFMNLINSAFFNILVFPSEPLVIVQKRGWKVKSIEIFGLKFIIFYFFNAIENSHDESCELLVQGELSGFITSNQ